jgi:hypothetical protein
VSSERHTKILDDYMKCSSVELRDTWHLHKLNGQMKLAWNMTEEVFRVTGEYFLRKPSRVSTFKLPRQISARLYIIKIVHLA